MAVEVSLEFEQWYQDEHPRLAASLVVIAGSVDLARDAVDEAFVRALERWSRVSRMESPTGWTYRVALNLVRRQHRRKTLEKRATQKAAFSVIVPGPAGETWQLVAELPPRQREAIVLRHIADMTEAEVASVMGVRRSTVSSTLKAAHQNLKSALTSEEIETHHD